MSLHPKRLFLALWLLLALGSTAQAATWNVSTTLDEADGSCLDGDCSLRDAVASASSGDKVALPAGTFLLTLGEILLDRDLQIVGAGARSSILDGQATTRIFTVNSAAAVAISGLTLQHGRANFAGAIYNFGNLTLRAVAILGNEADFAAGIYSQGPLSIFDSTIAGNKANSVGGIYGGDGVPLTIENSTISNNSANLLTGGLALIGPATIRHSTLAGNSVAQTKTWRSGALFVVGDLNLVSSLIEGNSPQNCDPFAAISASTSLDSDGTCLLSGPGNLAGVASQLQPLGNNGGPTDTQALPAGSPAVDVAACASAFDQRGTARPQGAGCEMGAFELTPGPIASTHCQRYDFSGGLGDLSFSLVGDADQGGVLTSGGRLQLTSDGSALYHASDHGGFLHRSVTGDFRIEVELTGFPVNAGGGYRRSGITVRTGTGPNDPRVYIEYLPQHPAYGEPALMFDYRGTDGVARELASTRRGLSLPLHLAIDRRGNRFSVAFSSDGINWVKPAGAAGGTVAIAMPAQVEVGLMQASYDTEVTLTSELDDFELCQPNPAPLPLLPAPPACDPGQSIDVVYLLDASGTAGAAFPGFASQYAAALEGMKELNDRLEAQVPGSQAAAIAFRGGPAPAYTTGAGARQLSKLTTSFETVEAAAAAQGVAATDPSTSSPLSQGLAKALELLQNEGRKGARPVIVLVSDGFVNVDGQGNGPGSYRTSEMQAISPISGLSYRTVGETGWLGNWNGPIATWDGEALANVMAEGLYLKETLPNVAVHTLGLHGAGNYRLDLLGFLADYGAGTYQEATGAASLETAVEAIFDQIRCEEPPESPN